MLLCLSTCMYVCSELFLLSGGGGGECGFLCSFLNIKKVQGWIQDFERG